MTIFTTILAVVLAMPVATATPVPQWTFTYDNPTPVALPTSSYECQVVAVPGAEPRVCCRWVTWRVWGRKGPERVEQPVGCDRAGETH